MNNIYISSCDENGGIYRYNFSDGRLIFKDKTDVDRPMYSVYDNGKLYVLIREIDKKTHFGGIMSFDVNDNGLGKASKISSTKGIVPCHLTVFNRNIYYVNYLSGNVCSLSGKEDVHIGKGDNLPRQDMAHTHYINISPDKKYLLSCDLGLDSIYTYDFNLNIKAVAKVPNGHGARHLAYSGDGKYVYCANELGSSVSVFSYEQGNLKLLSTYSTVGKTAKNNTVAAIREHDGYLYVSNRGENTIACFQVNGNGLELVGRNDIFGDSPRDFDFCGEYLICTNEKTDNITVFKVDKGSFLKTDEIKNIKNPLCVTVVKDEK